MASITNKHFSNHFKNLKDRMSKRHKKTSQFINANKLCHCPWAKLFYISDPKGFGKVCLSRCTPQYTLVLLGWVWNSICLHPWCRGVSKTFSVPVIFFPYPFIHTKLKKLNQKHSSAPWLAMLLSAWATFAIHFICLITWIPMYKSEVTDKMKMCCML